MKTIKELEKEIMQARIKAILKQYQNGEFAREAEIMHARMSVADSEKEIPLREKLYRIFGIFGRKDEYYSSFPQILHEELIKGDYLKRLACRLSIFAVFLRFPLFAGHLSVCLLCPADYTKTFGLPCINP